MTIDKIIELILMLIERFCPQASKQEIAAALQNPTDFHKRAFEREIRRELGIGPLAWLARRHEFMEPIYGACHMAGDEETLEAVLRSRK